MSSPSTKVLQLVELVTRLMEPHQEEVRRRIGRAWNPEPKSASTVFHGNRVVQVFFYLPRPKDSFIVLELEVDPSDHERYVPVRVNVVVYSGGLTLMFAPETLPSFGGEIFDLLDRELALEFAVPESDLRCLQRVQTC